MPQGNTLLSTGFIITTVEPVLPADASRKYMLIVNSGPDTVYIGFQTQVVSGSVPLVAGSYIEPLVPSTAAVYASSAGTSNIVVVEG